MEKTIYIVRHGETDYNSCHILQGSGVNLPLNYKGLFQAKCFYENYKHIPFSRIYTSTLLRSIQSVESFINKGIPHEADKSLIEISYGIYDGIASSADNNGPYKQLIDKWGHGDMQAKMPHGESPLDVQKRIKPFIFNLLSNTKDEYVLICIHGRVLRIFLSTLLNLDLEQMNLFTHNNMGLYALKYRSSIFCIEKFNDLKHLEV